MTVSEYKQSISLSVFTFGAPPWLLLIAIILQCLTLLGLLQFTANGFVNFGETPGYLPAISAAGLVASVTALFFSRRVALSSYSPLLHRQKIPYFVGFSYLVLGWVVTGIAFIAHSVILGNIHWPGFSEIGFGLSIGAVFGLLILFYIGRFGFEPPDNRNDLEEALDSVQNLRSEIVKSEKAPIELTDFYESLGDSVDQIEKILGESCTDGGKQLARDIDDWIDNYQSKPEVSQAAIVDWNRTTEEQDLRNLEGDFDSIVEDLERISNHG